MRPLSLVALVVLSACASGARGPDAETSPARSSPRVLTQEEIQRTTAKTAYEVVQQLRGNWLRARGVSSVRDPGGSMTIWVYVNGVRMGDTEALHNFRAEDVIEMRFLSATDATMRYGTGHGAGVIEVRTK